MVVQQDDAYKRANRLLRFRRNTDPELQMSAVQREFLSATGTKSKVHDVLLDWIDYLLYTLVAALITLRAIDIL